MRVKLLIGMLAIFWVGMILAIGMEAVVKFKTPSLTQLVAFDVGRTVFGAFNKVQCLLLILLVVGAIFAPITNFDRAFVAVIAATLVLQIFWFFPQLSARVDMLIGGVKPPKSYIHAAYGLLELIKLCLLIVLGVKWIW